VPTFVINLDKPPKERWAHVAETFKNEIKIVEKLLKSEIKIPEIAKIVFSWFKKQVFYYEEIKGIAEIVGVE